MIEDKALFPDGRQLAGQLTAIDNSQYSVHTLVESPGILNPSSNMAFHVQYLSWLIVLPALAAALLNYPALQQSLKQWMGVTVAGPVVTLPQGKLTGKHMSEGSWPNPVEGFLGVPYALPPVGNLRFANPVPVGKSSNTFDATEFGPRCVCLMHTSAWKQEC